MHVIIDQNQLSQGLQQASRIINPQNTLAVLNGIELAATTDGSFVLYSTDLTTGLTVHLNADVKEPGRLTIPSHTITELIRRIPTATVELVEHDGRLQVRYGKNRATLQTFGGENLPDFPPFEGLTLSLPPYTFQKISKEILFACSRDESRGVLRGVGLTFGHGRLVLEGTDGSRFSQNWMPVPEFLQEPTTLVLPPKAINEAARLEMDNPLQITLAATMIRVQNAHVTLSTRLLEGVYPDLSHAAPEEYVAECLVALNDFRGALERVQTITTKDHMSSVRVHLIPDQGIELMSSSQEVGNAVELVECESSGEELDLLFNPQYLIDALKAMSDDNVYFELSGTQSAARIRNAGGSNFFHAVLPMRQLV
ncbi:MAG: DNA polymerase III subunit beta [Firmicutes bacterium]|jgi:DNA polymerase-3 subunit beta|nr:DNA polymerase III subunit beta [Bacillota bacterium]MCL5064972.1 DNA polymerase III subunit beta [Bacillota bacterium]